MKLISYTINRPVPLEGIKDSTRYTIIVCVADQDLAGRDIAESIRYRWEHFDEWEGLIGWMQLNKVGEEERTIQ